jgi:thiol-disulfide isomerase/thioredoxin
VKRKRRKPEPRSAAGPQLAIVAGVLLLIAAVFVLKETRSDGNDPGSQDQVAVIPTADDTGALPQPASTLAAAAAPAPAGAQASLSSTLPSLPEAQLDQHLASGRPILAFFHSDTCVQCVQMTKIVEQVYPDFSDRIALVDVNVYDQRNQNLLRRARIQVIPTIILIGRDQQGKGYSGVMPADTLRAELQALALEP